MEEMQKLLPKVSLNKDGVGASNTYGSSGEEWTDGSSCSSYYSETDSSDPEWETLIEPNGDLLYIDCHPFVDQQVKETNANKSSTETAPKNTDRSTRGKLLKLLRRRDSKRRSKRSHKSGTSGAAGGEATFGQGIADGLNPVSANTKVKFHDCQEGELREVVLKIDQGNRHKLGRRATLVEALLGLTISPLSDGNRIMVAGFIPDNDPARYRNIKIGDWLKSINDKEVNLQNINEVLNNFTENVSVCLKLQRVVGVEVTKEPPANELKNQSYFVRQLTTFLPEENQQLMEFFLKQPVGILYLNTESITETGPEFEGVLYCYPEPMNKNILCNSRGVFLTLNHLLHDITKSKPVVSSLLATQAGSVPVSGTVIGKDSKGSKVASGASQAQENPEQNDVDRPQSVEHLTNVVYTSRGDNKLLLLMLPDCRFGVRESMLLNTELIRNLEFTYQNMDNCFSLKENKLGMDNFFSRFFARVLSSDLWCSGFSANVSPDSYAPLVDADNCRGKLKTEYRFEDLLPAAHWIPLPNEAQMQIDDALSELEASDYREWNEDPMDCQRLYTILGSALYHNGYLLASHLQWGDLVDIHGFCRQNGYLHLSRHEPVRSMVIWKEVFPYSCNRGLKVDNSPYVVPEGRRYLLIVGSGQNLLTVLMEAGGCTEPPEDFCGPDAFYVEEAEATLAHIQELGLAELADRWISTNPGTQITVPEIHNVKRKSDFLGNIFNKSVSPTPTNKELTPPMQKVTSILKRRSPDAGVSTSTSLFSLQSEEVSAGEDSLSQSGYSERSEVSATDEPVLGRRAIREKGNVESDESDSDWEAYRDGSQKSSSSYDLSELRQNLLSETEDIRPPRLTAGLENVLLHYVQLDTTEGILISPPTSTATSHNMEHILNNFKNCSQTIHDLFANTIRFKNMLAQDMAKSVINKSLIAIKEHGVLFECPFLDESGVKMEKAANISYWVIGRLFSIPYPREIYICYHESVPQNLIEFAFKLAVSVTI